MSDDLSDFGGSILRPGTASYDQARVVYNSMVDKRPGLIAQCSSPDDVAAALRYGVAEGLEVAVRGGGHGVSGAAVSDGGLVIDLRMMRGVEIDQENRLARVSGGATWADLDTAGQRYGLATTGGRVSTTGVAGLTLGGGSGWLERKHGFACDALVSVDLITADGRSVTADETSHSELFWALHGGGGNFGVATALTFRLRPVATMTLAMLFWPAVAGDEVLRTYRDLFDDGVPEELGGGVLFLTGPPEPFVPPHLQGKRLVVASAVHAGSEAETRDLFAPMFELAPEATMVAELPYAAIQSALDTPAGFRNYWSAEHLSAFPDDAISRYCARADEMPSPSTSQQLTIPWGGAVARSADEWPLPHRHAAWVVHPFGQWTDPRDDEQVKSWARGVCTDLAPWATGSVYLNLIGDEGPDRIRTAYGEGNYLRLAEVKGKYDPANVFHLNHNILPA
ncbi:FAD-binding oxidoreductase [Kribbella sp. NPDC056861]|uniref:FAD-binding oxidoreductase n=1 Tax=Kribbella sp. NPDC056861 TaxID=3154857 RepID=UPI003427E840